jgi:hypothetical protein
MPHALSISHTIDAAWLAATALDADAAFRASDLAGDI